MEIQEILDDMDNDKLIAEFNEAKIACQLAAEQEKNSEWHESCFAAILVFVGEIEKRGIDLRTLH